ncbi:MAG: recombination mediator RecR [Patescibacteria group bacterium]
MLPDSLKKFIESFSKIPGIGPRQAQRIAFWFLKKNKNLIYSYAFALKDLADKTAICPKCFFVFEPNSGPNRLNFCQICRNPSRDKTILTLVEKETDLISLEKTKKYQGLYFILGGLFSPLKKSNGQEIRIKELLERLKNDSSIKELVLGLSHTAEGDLTAMELEKLLSPFNLKITRLGLGLPRGAEIEFADEDTLTNALTSRR